MHSYTIQFDNAATTPPLPAVNTAVQKALIHYASLNRSTSTDSDFSTLTYARTKQSILSFLGLSTPQDYTVVYTKNTTEGINLLAHTLIKDKNTKVLLTRMEHHSNDLPWRYHATPEYVEIDPLGRLDLEDLQRHLEASQGDIAYVCVTAASNVTGYETPIHQIAKLAHHYNAQIIVDAAQLVAHKPINMLGNSKEEALDYLVFSGHKMYAPYGSGVIVGRFPPSATLNPFILGGGTVRQVTDTQYLPSDAPHGLEGGTQNLLGAIAIEAALQEILRRGFPSIVAHETKLQTYLIENLRDLRHIILYGDSYNFTDRLGVIPFNIKGIPYGEVSSRLSQQFHIATRCGKMCAHPYVERLLHTSPETVQHVPHYYGEEGMVRISIGLLNTLEDCTYLLEILATHFH
ncbi:MAG: aminotransferase class V-fold PLP-dependent enzyme [Cellulosilyticaceae bacterium]